MAIINDLTDYQLVLTTSFEAHHGVSGHLYELIDYFYIASQAGIRSAVLLTDGTSIDTFIGAAYEKYDFSPDEFENLKSNTFYSPKPKLIRAKNICIVDGSPQLANCIVYADNVFLFRCSVKEMDYFSGHRTIKKTHLMQDFSMYTERYEDLDIAVIDYVKKILWQKYRYQKTAAETDTAMFYLTTNCRALPSADILAVIEKYDYTHYLIVTNFPDKYKELASDKISIESAPVKNIFDRFDAYIYTATPKKADCSPRFIVECAVYGKDVVYEIDYIDPGIASRQRFIDTDINLLQLNVDDYFIEYFKKVTDV